MSVEPNFQEINNNTGVKFLRATRASGYITVVFDMIFESLAIVEEMHNLGQSNQDHKLLITYR